MAADLLSQAPVRATLHLRFLDFRIDVETNSLRAAGRLRQYFRAYLADAAGPPDMRLSVVRGAPAYDAARLKVWAPSTSSRVPKESYYDRGAVRYILKNRTGMLIQLGERDAAIIGDVDRHLNQVVNLVSTLFGLSLQRKGYVMLHASAVVRADSDEAMIFLGNSGSGKSSLALQLIERGGFDFVSNDRVLLRIERGQVRIVGLPKKPRVNPGTLLASKSLVRLLPARKRPVYERLPAGELWNIEDKTDVDVARVLGARERLSGRLVRAYSLEWKPSGEGLAVVPLDPAGALAAMRATAKDFGPYDLGRTKEDGAAREFGRIARACEFVAVRGKADPRAFATTLAAPSAARARNRARA